MSQTITNIEVYCPKVKLAQPVSDAANHITHAGMTLVRITSSEGLYGYGMTFATPVAEYITKMLKPLVIGKDPMCVQDIWNRMHRAICLAGRKGIALLAVSAVDIAIWDLRGKILGLPIYKMLGGSNRFIPTYCSGGWTSDTIDELVEESKGFVAAGYSTIKIKVGIEEGKNLREDARRVAAVRKAVGDDIEILIDANSIWDSSQAIRFAKMIEDYNIAVFEEPVMADDIPGLRRVRRMTTIPVATGGSEYTKYGMRDLITGEATDIVQLDVTKAGGYTEYQKIAALVEAWNMRLAPHAWEFLGANVLSPLPVQNAAYLEKLPYLQEEIFKKVMFDYAIPKNGLYEIPDRPGLGYEFDMEFVKRNDTL